ncbi:MAG: tetratricopeptide repeat protein [Deltaproteobacteria bacterium]|nr:MAG: tetratricopeptide repeat protein [Deltaproteobacteria bacterium]
MKVRSKALCSSVLVFAALTAVVWVAKSTRSLETVVTPEVLHIGPSQVTVAWCSETVYLGRIFYREAGSEGPTSSAVDTFGPSYKHEVVIRGLSPSTRYVYWQENSETHYQFQTQPAPTTPFSFLVVWGDVSDRVTSLMMSEFPEFIVALTARQREGDDPFTAARPYIPVFSSSGLDSPYLKSVQHGSAQPSIDRSDRPRQVKTWRLNWGGVGLVFLNLESDNASEVGMNSGLTTDVSIASVQPWYADGQRLAEVLTSSGVHTIGFVLGPEIVGALMGGKETRISLRDDHYPGEEIMAAIRDSVFHENLAQHNRRFPERPAAFVLLFGGEDLNVEVDGIHYLGLRKYRSLGPVGDQRSGALRIDVALESTRAVFLDDSREVVLRKPALGEKRTCEECRRLADQGAYEASILAYREFIETHTAHFQIDDAYFAIAEILDEKLFRFSEALNWYHRLVEVFPRSSLSPVAQQRIDFLSAHRDYGFEPLATFERIRKIEYSRKGQLQADREKLLHEIQDILVRFPDCSLAPVIHYWLANQYRRADPDRAVSQYRDLQQRFPHHPYAQEVWLEIAETYYEAGRFSESLDAYQQAISSLPSSAENITAQMARAKRNLRRGQVVLACWVTLALLGAVAVLWPPMGLRWHEIKWSGFAFLPLALVLSAAGWLIHEQFSSLGELLTLVLGFSACATLGFPFTAALAQKLLGCRDAEKGWESTIPIGLLGAGLGMIAFIAGIYLVLFYANEHYLIVVGM